MANDNANSKDFYLRSSIVLTFSIAAYPVSVLKLKFGGIYITCHLFKLRNVEFMLSR